MQLYEVRFKIEHSDSYEIGKCLVTGENEENAIKKVIFHLDFKPQDKINFECTKLKPQIYQLDRMTIIKSKEEIEGNKIKKTKSKFLVAACGEIFTQSKSLALIKMSKHLKNIARNENYKDDAVPFFDMEIEEKCFITQGLQQPYIDKQSIFEKVIFYHN